ncbi:MAG: hypothetical protein J5497_03595, partial [Selenomonadaceae bacterium]|nr:hypothetical protein [Selenomonadaceae bacterium]
SLPSANSANKVTLVGDNFNDVYGVFGGTSGTYTLDTVESTAKLGRVTISGVENLTATNGLTNVTYYAPVATFAVTNDNADGYQVTLTGDAASVTSGEIVTLISGAMKTDSNVAVYVADSLISASASSIVTLTAGTRDGTISGLDTLENSSFHIEGLGTYNFSQVGLTHGGKYLLSSKEGSAVLSSINTASAWGTLLGANALTLTSDAKNALVVDDVDNARILYADLVSDSNGISLSRSSGGSPWDLSNTIYIDNITASLSSDFAGTANAASIEGIQSGAKFTVTDAKTFTVNDNGNGAVIGNATTYSITSGLVSITVGQTVSSAAGNISADTGSFTFSVSGSSATIGASDANDIFSLDGTQYRRYGVGLMTTNDDKLWTGEAFTSEVSVDSLKSNAWTESVLISNNSLAIMPTVPSSSAGPWIITDRNARYGSLSKVTGGGYRIEKEETDTVWNPNYTIAISNDTLTLTTDYVGVNIACDNSGAQFSVRSASSDFVISDIAAGATISSEASIITQTAGLIAPQKGQAIVVGTNTIKRNNAEGKDDAITVSVSSGAATVAGIDSGETFYVNEVAYVLLSNGRFLRADGKVYSGDAISTSNGAIGINDLLTDSKWNALSAITTEGDGKLIIDDTKIKDLSATNAAAFVVDPTTDGSTPTVIYGTLTNNGTGYTLTTDGKSSGVNLTSVTVTNKAQPISFSADFVTQAIPITAYDVADFVVTTASTGFTVNYISDKVVVANATALNLTNGKLTLNDSAQTVYANSNAITAGTNTEITVNYSASAATPVTIGGLNSSGESVTVNSVAYGLISGDGFGIGLSSATELTDITVSDLFSVGSTSYLMTSIGLATGDMTKLNKHTEVLDTHSFTTDKLSLSNWDTIYQADGGALSLATSTPTSARVVDLTDPANAATYGTINYSGGVYTLSLSSADGDIAPTSLEISSGIFASLPADCADTPITALSATFTATSTSAFTVDARGNYAIVSVPLNLSAGTLQAVVDKTVTVQGKDIIATNSTTMTVGINSSGKAFVGELDEGDTFTIGGVSYEMTAAGVRKGNLIVYDNSGTFIIDEETVTNILSVDGTNLDLRGQDASALVYDSNVKTKIGTLIVGSAMNLTGESSAADNIKTIDIDATTVFNVDFATKVNAPSGLVTVNGNPYTAAGNIVISATANDSSLYSGTVNLASDDSVKASNGTLTVIGGSLSATAALGSLTTIDGLDPGESFEFGGKSYVQSTAGLMLGSTICEGLSGTSININGLTTGKFVNVLAPVDGELDIRTVTSNANIYDDATNPTTRLAALTINGTRYTLKDNGSASSAIDTVDIKTGSTLTIDFAAQVEAPIGTVTVNGRSYVGTTALTVDATTSSSTLNEGTITLNATSTATNSATADKALKAVSGSITATASKGAWTELGDLANDESFTLDGTTYTQKGMGLTKGGTSICEDLAGTTIFIDALNSATWTNYVTTNSGGVLELSNVTNSPANVYNNAVTSRLGTVTKSDNVYTLDYAGQVSSVAGTVTVNGKTYAGSTALTIATTASTSTKDSTLYAGTVSIASGNSVTADETITVNSGTLTATASGGKWTTLDGLSNGTTFTIDGTTYQVSGTDTLVELVDGTLAKLYTNYISNGTIAYSELTASNFYAIYELDANNVLDVTEKTLSTEQTIVVGHSAPTTRVAELNYSTANGYTLSARDDGNTTNFKGVKIGSKAPKFSTELETTITTTDTTTYTVNGKTFVALEGLSIATTSDDATLSDG